MLIRFLVENFLSFKGEVEFSMIAGMSRKHPEHLVRVRDLRLLKTGVIVGANASGKTNLIKALSFVQDFITTGSLRTEKLELTPFLLDIASADNPSKFLIEIQCGIGQHFEYKFEVDLQRVHKESLYEILPASERMIFERKTDPNGHTHVDIGKVNVLVTNEEDPFDFIRRFRPNELFLTAVNTEAYARFIGDDEQDNRNGDIQNRQDTRPFIRPTTLSPNANAGSLLKSRIAYLNIIYDWFNVTLAPIFTDSVLATGIPIGLMKPGELQERYLEILEKLDLGIDEIGLQQNPDFNAETHLSDEFKEKIAQYLEQIELNSDQHAVFYNRNRDTYLFVDTNLQHTEFKLATIHRATDEQDRKVFFDLSMESDGTRRLLRIIPALFGLISEKADYVFLLDELDRSLHRQLSYKLMELFLENSGNRKSQLIVTAHDTSLLDLDLLRRDEIWFLEKDRYGVSSLYSLEEFELSRNMNIEKSYLGGRLGAIPILTSDDKLEWAE